MKLDASHPAVSALRKLLPDGVVSGGSFADWLPHPRTIPPEDRERILRAAQELAAGECLRDLSRHMDLEPNASIGVGQGGIRLWPNGFVGSTTHKGTVVLGVVFSEAVLESVGIDLELIERAEFAGLEKLIAPEGLPAVPNSVIATVLAFSAKEAVYKAWYPLGQRPLGFGDVRLKWTSLDGDRYRAEARCPGSRSFGVQCMIVRDWILSTADSRYSRQRGRRFRC